MKPMHLKSNPAQHERRKNGKTVDLITAEDVRARAAWLFVKRILTAQSEAHSTSIKAALACKAASGFWPIKAPFGYKAVRRNSMRAVLLPNKQQASVISEIFKSYAEGRVSIDDLVRLAAEKDLHRVNSTKPLGAREIVRILQNPVYCGIIQWKDIVTCGNHVKLVSIPVWAKVQVRLRIDEKTARTGTRRR